ncbi:MAG: response regulator [Lachnospiraceae bacterium]|nr:response regulator [Lachnospiraceae bacterium]
MKTKLLLVGKISEILANIQGALEDEFDVQMCSTQLKSLQGMVKIFKPALIVVCTIGVYDMEPGFASWIDKNTGKMPVVFIAQKDEINEYRKSCISERYTYLNPPIDLDTIFDTCIQLVKQDPDYKDKSTIRHILTIDDSPMVLRFIKSVLKDEYDVFLATGGEMGIKKAKETKPDLILLDYEMPEMDGRETFLNLKVDEDTEKIPVIFLTSVSDPKRVKDVISMQPAGYILKPVEADKLIEKVHEVLGAPEI